MGWGVNINAAANVQFNNNVLFHFRNFGINIQQGSNITLDSNIVVKIVNRNWDVKLSTDKYGGIAICSYKLWV